MGGLSNEITTAQVFQQPLQRTWQYQQTVLTSNIYLFYDYCNL